MVKAIGVNVVNNGHGIVIAGNTGLTPTSGRVRAIIQNSVMIDNLGVGLFDNKRAVAHDSVISGNGAKGVSVATGRASTAPIWRARATESHPMR